MSGEVQDRYAHLDRMNAETRRAAHDHMAPIVAEVEALRSEGLTWAECAERVNAAGFTSRLGLPFTDRGLLVAVRRFRARAQAVAVA